MTGDSRTQAEDSHGNTGVRRAVMLLIASTAVGAVPSASAAAQTLPPVVPALPPVVPPLPPVVPPRPVTDNSLPTIRDVVRNPGGTVTITGGGAVDLRVDVRSPRAIIDWRRFDVPAGRTAFFNDATNTSGRPVAVLNRVVGDAGLIDRSDIFGNIGSSPNLQVFLLNPAGILIGGNGAISTGSFVASTLSLSDADFEAGRFNFTPGRSLPTSLTSQQTIVTGVNTNITTASGPLVLVAEQIAVAGTLRSARDIVMVAASDVSMDLRPGSPVSMTINRGTPMQGPLTVRGRITGQNVYLATATRGGVGDTLLDVNAVLTANTAVATDRGIVLVAGQGDGAFGGVTVAANGNTSGNVGVRIDGPIVATGPAGGIAIRANGISEGGGLTLAAGRDVILNATRGAIALGTSSIDARGGVGVRTGPGQALALGTVAADRLTGLGAAGLAPTLFVDGNVTTRDLTLRGTLDLTSTGTVRTGAIAVSAGDLRIGGGRGVATGALDTSGTLALASDAGDINIASARAGGNAFFDARGALSAPSITAQDVRAVVGGTIKTRTIDARGAITLDGGSVSATTLLRAGTSLDVTSRTGVIRIQSAEAGGDVRLISAGGLSVIENLVAGGAATLRAADIDANRIGAGSAVLNADGALRVGSARTAGDLTATAGTTIEGAAGGRAFLNAGGALSVTAGGGALLGDLSGASVNLRAASLDVSAVDTAGEASLRSAGALTLGRAASAGTMRIAGGGAVVLPGNLSAGGDLLVAGANVSLGGNGFVLHSAAGRVDVTATAGEIAGRTGLTLLSNIDGIGGEALVLDATGGGIAFADGTRLFGGTGQDSVVAVRLATPGSTLRLDQVTASRFAITDAGRTGFSAPRFDGSVRLGALRTTQALDLTVRGALSLGSAVVTGAGEGILLNAGEIDAGTLDARGTIAANSTGTVRADSVRSRDARVAITGRSVALTSANAETTLAINATGGDAQLGSGNSGGDAAIDATGSASFTSLVSRGGNVTVRAGNAVDGGVLTAPGTASIEAGGAVRLADIAAGAVRVAGGTIALDRARTPGPLTLTSRGALTLGTAEAGTALVLAAGSVTVSESLSTGGDLSITAGEDLAGGTIRSGGNAVLTAGRDIAGGTLIAAGAARVSAARALRLASIDAASVTTQAETIAIERARTPGALVLDSRGDIVFGGGEAGTATLRAGGAAAITGSLTTAGDLLITAGGDLAAGTLRSGGAAVLTSGRDITSGTLTAAGPARVSATRALRLASIDAASLTGDAGSIAIERARTPGALVLDSRGDLVLGGGEAGTATLRAAGAAAVTGSLTTAGDVSITAGGDLAAGTLRSGGAAVLTSGRDVTSGSLTATGPATVTAAGALRMASIDARSVTAEAGSIALERARSASTLALTSRGDMSLGIGEASGAATLQSGGNLAITQGLTAQDVALRATGDAALAAVTSRGGVTVMARSVSGGGVTAAGPATLDATGSVQLDRLASGGSTIVRGGSIALGNADAGGTLSLTSGGALALGGGRSGGAAMLDAVGTATLGAFAAPTITLRAADAELGGRLTATSIRIANRDATAAGVMRLGDGAGTGGFRLSNAEVGQLDAGAVLIDAGAGDVELGTVDIGASVGRQTFDLAVTGTIDVSGAVTAGGSGRMIRLGGGADPASFASSIRVASTADGGGRLLVGDNNLELRAARIGVGQEPGFLDVLDAAVAAGTPPGDAAGALVANPNSALYNAGFGGRSFAPGTTLVSARTLTLRFSDYALFQNTGVAGSTSGVVVGGTPALPVQRALVIEGGGSGRNAFALFGTINGFGSDATALLGPDIIVMNGIDLANTRINGCPVAAGGGCLTNVIVQPVLGLFDVEETRVFAVADALAVPFDAAVASSNEALFASATSPLGDPGAGLGDFDDTRVDERDPVAAPATREEDSCETGAGAPGCAVPAGSR